jgi:hypothetical protein
MTGEVRREIMEASACLHDSHVTTAQPPPSHDISAANCHEIYHIISLHLSALHGYKLGTNSRCMTT